jgi:uncharacterized pyridoxal phosphate-containing UPF0001 family protein
MCLFSEFESNLKSIRATISRAAADSDRSPTSITLIGVSKQQPEDRMGAAS